MPADLRHAAGDGRWGDRRRLTGAREEERGRRGRRERRDGRDGPGACDARGLRPRHRSERHDAVRPRVPVPRADHRRGDGARLVLRSPAGAGRDVRRPRAPEGRARSLDGVDPHEGRYRHEARPQHALHRRDDPARPRVWQPHGGPDGALRQAAGPRGADRDGMLQRGPRGGSQDRALLHVALGERFAGAVLQLLAQAKVAPRDVSFIASHGQTIWHEPGRATLQLGDPAVIAERVGVRVVSDFRSRDVAAGGQGAPLVPLADVVLFGHPECGRLLLNIGGIANVTFAPRRGVTGGALAFDTGPGVAVVDAVTRRIDPAASFDAGGERARRGKPSRKVLEALLADPYFAAPPPKSTGRERFGPDYAARLLDDVKRAGGSDNDAVATATALTVETIARGIERWTPARPSDELVISGGGARNPRLVELLTTRVAPRPVVPFEALFFDGEAKEALVFAFLGFLTLLVAPGNLPAATGARGPRVHGHIPPA